MTRAEAEAEYADMLAYREVRAAEGIEMWTFRLPVGASEYVERVVLVGGRVERIE